MAIDKFSRNNFDSLISVKQGFPPWWSFRLNGNNLVPFAKLDDGRNAYNLERQELPKVFEANGAIYITDRSGSLINPSKCGYVVMDHKSSLDIDNQTDFILCELVIKAGEKPSKNSN